MPGRKLLLGAVACLALLLAGLAVAGVRYASRKLFPLDTPAFRAADRLTRAAYAGPLSAADRDLLLDLCEHPEHAVVMRAWAILPLAVDRNPDWRPAVVEHLTRLAADSVDRTRQGTGKSLLAKLARRPAAP